MLRDNQNFIFGGDSPKPEVSNGILVLININGEVCQKLQKLHLSPRKNNRFVEPKQVTKCNAFQRDACYRDNSREMNKNVAILSFFFQPCFSRKR